ncbi:MAG: helix-turn-helix transcriptional regulator [Candidatus Woesebacteria bacterium]|jgi:transcriptional regulator with XRE-family HTH domain
MNTRIGKVIGANLQKTRKELHLTQEEAAKKVGLTTNYYAMLERGEATASIETYYAIFSMLGVKASDILPERA